MVMENDFPRPERPTNLRSLNLATWFFITAVQFLSSAQKFSSFPALMVTIVPSWMSSRATTLKAHGRLLLDLQWVGRVEQRTEGEPVVTSSPWYSWRSSCRFAYISWMICVCSGSCLIWVGGVAVVVAPSLFGRCIVLGFLVSNSYPEVCYYFIVGTFAPLTNHLFNLFFYLLTECVIFKIVITLQNHWIL